MRSQAMHFVLSSSMVHCHATHEIVRRHVEHIASIQHSLDCFCVLIKRKTLQIRLIKVHCSISTWQTKALALALARERMNARIEMHVQVIARFEQNESLAAAHLHEEIVVHVILSS
jgi:hypothetical protein